MTPTEELRKRLDELGIEWWQRKGHTCWNVKKDEGIELWRAWVAPNGTITLKTDAIYGLTPEQAIAATVGVGTCKDLGGTGADGEDVFNCSECGCVLSLYDGQGVNTLCTSFIYDYPRFCPECGAKVVSE